MRSQFQASFLTTPFLPPSPFHRRHFLQPRLSHKTFWCLSSSSHLCSWNFKLIPLPLRNIFISLPFLYMIICHSSFLLAPFFLLPFLQAPIINPFSRKPQFSLPGILIWNTSILSFTSFLIMTFSPTWHDILPCLVTRLKCDFRREWKV